MQDALQEIQRGKLQGMSVADGAWSVTSSKAALRLPVRLVALTEAYPARVYVVAARGVARLPLNAAAKKLLGLDVRGPVCILAPEARPPEAPPPALPPVAANPSPCRMW